MENTNQKKQNKTQSSQLYCIKKRMGTAKLRKDLLGHRVKQPPVCLRITHPLIIQTNSQPGKTKNWQL